MKRTVLIWLALMLATATTYALGRAGAMAGTLGSVVLMFALAVFKGWWVVLDFMELRRAPPLWRRLMLGWLWIVPSGLVLVYALGR